MRLLERTADRLVGLLVPNTSAAACACGSDPYSTSEGCQCTWEGYQYLKSCNIDCNCHTYCGPCRWVYHSYC